MWKIKENFVRLGNSFFSHTKPVPINKAHLVHVNQELLMRLGLNGLSTEYLASVISGERWIEEYEPLATIYAGHQFGMFVPQLGDGRALLIAEHLAPDNQIYEFQLKGSGKTPYSRMGDGRAVLRSSIREYLVSHAMFKLGIPTTQALGLVHSKAVPVYREKVETSAIVLRVSPSFIRFGHFELFASRNQKTELNQLISFVIENYYPEISCAQADYILDLLDRICLRTARTIAAWQAAGFTHGVMNTDNMSILGLTLDYGPYSFMDTFRPEHPYNHSDTEGRYTYAKQAYIGWWNLYRLAEALAVVYPYPDKLEGTLAKYSGYYNSAYTQLMAAKLGFAADSGFKLELSEQLVKIILEYRMDWTYTWRKLSFGTEGVNELISVYNLGSDFKSWYQGWQSQLKNNSIKFEQAVATMKKSNPAIALRNHLLQSAIDRAETFDYSEVVNLFEALSNPYEELPKFGNYYKLPPSWAENMELSCSS